NEGQSTNEGVGSDLECQRSERLVVTGNTLIGLLVVIRVHALDGRDLVRSRQEVDNGVQHQRHTLVLERGAADSRNDFAGEGTLTQTGLDLFQSQVALFQVLVHQLFVGFSSCFNQVFAVLIGQL